AMVNRGLNSDEVAEPNLLAIPGTIAAYEHGHDWLQALIKQLNVNFAYAQEFISKNLPQVKVVAGNATYLIWLDVERISTDSQKLAEFLEKETGLVLSPGSIYRGNGNKFLRMNLACPLTTVKDGLERLRAGLTKYSA
ncbi:MAG: plastocyanin, partial [Lactobacillus helsingborgensis]|nr:plastocyanin [Lactobacillus helsingborgensis]